jgi:hypothetical protein
LIFFFLPFSSSCIASWKSEKRMHSKHFSITRQMDSTFCLLPSLPQPLAFDAFLRLFPYHARTHTRTHSHTLTFWTLLAHLFIWCQPNGSIFGYGGLQSSPNTAVRNSTKGSKNVIDTDMYGQDIQNLYDARWAKGLEQNRGDILDKK